MTETPKKTKKLLALLGSPREDGNSAKMLSLAVRAAEKSGWHTDVVMLYEKKIAYCTGCMLCKPNGICEIEEAICGKGCRGILSLLRCPLFQAGPVFYSRRFSL